MVKKRKIFLTLSFGVPVIIMLILFVCRGIYPFGDRSFLFSDMYHQYMPFFSEFIRKIKAGEGLAYSWNVGIGSNFLALYVYYLASPFHWLAFLVPEGYLMEFMSYLVIVKIGFCGFSMAYYLQKRFEKADITLLMVACFYALSGFTAAYNWNIMWLDCVVLLPLVVLGLELLVKEGKCGFYCCMLGLSIFTNYYLSIMLCFFLVLYFLILLLTEKRSWRILGNFVLYSLLAGGMAAILLIPEVCAIIVTDFGNMNFPGKAESYFSVLDMLARHCMGVMTERGLAHWPNIYCGVIAFLLVPLYAVCPKLSIRKRFAYLALAGFLLLSFSTNVLDFIWHGFNFPDSLPARQSFLYIFVILVMCYEAYLHVEELTKQHILYIYLGVVAFLLFCEKLAEQENFAFGVAIWNLVFVSCYAILLYRTRGEKQDKFRAGCVAMAVVIAEVIINTSMTSVGTVSRSEYLGQQKDYQALYEYTMEREDGLYRLEKFTRKTKNDGTLAGFPTASVFSSTMNSSVMNLYRRLGMRHSKVYYGFDGATAFTAALLNVNYMFGESGHYENSLYRLLEQSGDIYLYENMKTLPFGYVAPTGYDIPKGDGRNGIRTQNQLVKILGLNDSLFIKIPAKTEGNDIIVTAEEEGIYYARLTSSGTTKVDALGGVLEIQKFQDLKGESIIYLGHLYENESITLTNGAEEDITPLIQAEVYRLEEKVLDEALEILSKQHLTEVICDSTHVSGRLSLEEAGRLILSIPYETGWTVTINGEECVPELFGKTLMAFDLEPGEYQLSMSYQPTGSFAGVIVSVVSLGAFLVLMLVTQKRKSFLKQLLHSVEENEKVNLH